MIALKVNLTAEVFSVDWQALGLVHGTLSYFHLAWTSAYGIPGLSQSSRIQSRG